MARRLLHLDEHGKLSLTKYSTEEVPPYAILSHTWGSAEDEVSFQDLQNGTWVNKAAKIKIDFCLMQAQKDGISHFWIDTCCINKQDKHGEELSRAITSMFHWYAESKKCYVYLSDIASHKRGIDDADVPRKPSIEGARYWTRGWTLQELLAPKCVEFFSRNGDYLGDRSSLRQEIHSITGISLEALDGKPLSCFTVEKRLQWAEGRQTSEIEDRAYCLGGILGVSLVPHYGEGDYAYERLMNEVKAAMQTSLSRIPAPWTTPHSSPPKTISGSEHRQALLESLRFEQMDSRRNTIKRPDSSTCEWFMSHTAYVDWMLDGQQNEPHFLWLIGKPGAGKSTLMKYALHKAKNVPLKDETVISFFFNARGDQLEKSTEGMYRALLWQLFDQMTDMQDIMDNLPRQAWTLSSLQSLFLSAASRLQQRRVRCFIDALDECPEEEVRDMISFLEDLTTESDTYLCICFASRHYPTIDIRYGQRLILEAQEGHGADITRYVQKHLRAGKGSAAESIKETIRVKANHVFLWVVLVVRILNDEYRTGRIFRVKQRLDELPPELGSLFRDILLRDSTNKADMLLALQWVLFAARPLSREEFYFGMVAGLATEPTQVGYWDREQLTPEDMVRFVLDSSKGLAELTKSKKPTVQFIHESVRDYLIKENGMSQLWPDLGPNLQERGHYELSRCCRKYIETDLGQYEQLILSLPKAKSGSCRQLRAGLSNDYPFLEYAVQFTWHHLEHSSPVMMPGIVETFDLAKWTSLSNAFQQHDTRRYEPSVSLPYILASSGFPRLLSSLARKHLYRSVSPQNVEEKNRLIFAAAANGHLNAVMVLLTSMAPEDENDVLEGNIACSNVERSVLDARDKLGCTLLHWAARWDWPDIARSFVSLSPKVSDLVNKKAETPLHYAASYGSQDVFRVLLDSGASVVTQDKRGWTALHHASAAGHAKQLALLDAADVDWNRADNKGYTPLILASEAGQSEVVKVLLTKDIDLHRTTWVYATTALGKAIEKDRHKVVQLLLEKCPESPYVGGVDGETALHMASSYDAPAVAQLLIEHGADVDARDGAGSTPLHKASFSDSEALMQLLLDCGADVNARDASGATPLHKASDSSSAMLLLDRGADVNARDASGATPLHKASDPSSAMLLLDRGADIHARNDEGATPLHNACLWDWKIYIGRLLVQQGADIEALDSRGQTPLFYASGCVDKWLDSYESIKYLLGQGANVAAVDNFGRTALHYACSRGSEDRTRLLVENGAPTSVRDNDGQTPSDLAARHSWDWWPVATESA